MGMFHQFGLPTYALFSCFIPAFLWVVVLTEIIYFLNNVQTIYYTKKILGRDVSIFEVFSFAFSEIISLTISSILSRKFIDVITELKDVLFKDMLASPAEEVDATAVEEQETKDMPKSRSGFLSKIKQGKKGFKDTFEFLTSFTQTRLFKLLTKIITREFLITLSFLDEIIISYLGLQVYVNKYLEKKKITVKDKTLWMFEGLVLYIRAIPDILIKTTSIDLFIIFANTCLFLGSLFLFFFILSPFTLITRIALTIIFHTTLRKVIEDIFGYSIRLYLILGTFYETIAGTEDLNVDRDIVALVSNVPMFKPFKSKLRIKTETDNGEVEEQGETETQEEPSAEGSTSLESLIPSQLDIQKILNKKYMSYLSFFNIDNVDLEKPEILEEETKSEESGTPTEEYNEEQSDEVKDDDTLDIDGFIQETVEQIVEEHMDNEPLVVDEPIMSEPVISEPVISEPAEPKKPEQRQRTRRRPTISEVDFNA